MATSTIIRASDQNHNSKKVAFNFEDMATQADQYLNHIRSEATKIIQQAQQDAKQIRVQAEAEGRQAGLQSTEEIIQKQLAQVIPALKQASQSIFDERQVWLRHWEATSVHVAAEIAKRVIRRELSIHPEITLTYIREALELAAGNAELRILLNPADYQALGSQVQMLVEQVAPLVKTEITADSEVTSGGCRIETRFGVIDQQIETQLKRIEEELA